MDKETKKMTITIILISIASQILRFGREALLALNIGCCFKTDSYFLAFMAATIVADLIGEGISTSMIPVLQKIKTKDGLDRKIDYINNLLNISIVASLGLMLMTWLVSPLVVKILGSSFSPSEYKVTLDLMKLGLPIILFILIRAIFVAFLQSNHAFKAGAKSWIYYNIVYMIYLSFFSDYGTHGLMIAGIIASASQLIPIILASKDLGYKYERILDFGDVYLREILIIILPLIIGLSINRINLFIDNTIASSLGEASVSVLNYADDIVQLVLGVFIITIVTVLFPLISQEYTENRGESTKATIKEGIGLILKVAIPATIILIMFSGPIVSVLFERGEFDARASFMTSQALVYYSIGIGAMGLILILTRVYYAMNKSLTPMFYGAIGILVNLLLNIILSKYMGAKGIALATSLSSILVAGLLVKDLQEKIDIIHIKENIKSGIRLTISLVFMAASMGLGFYILEPVAGQAISLIMSIVAGLIVYIGLNIRRSSL